MRTTKFNHLFGAVLTAAVLILSGCEAESPTQPTTQPPGGGTPPPSSPTIVLTVSNANPLVQSTSTITATVTQGGVIVPNGTAVEFETDLGTFADTGGNISIRTTTNGVATAILTSATAGTAKVFARVNNISAQTSVTFRTQPPGPTPIITSISSISPTKGGPAGGQEVIIRGQNFKAPIRVLFGDKPAASVLISSTEIRAVTPSTNLGPSNQFEEVDVVVISEAGTQVEQRATSPQKFRYELVVLQPAITTLSPSSGPNEGNTRVTIFGEGFSAPIKVFFGVSGSPGSPLVNEVEAEVQGAPSFNQVVVLTPPALGLGTELANRQVTVRVLNVATGKDAVMSNAFRYGPGMQITAAGPTTLDATGGDRVTIDGWGFDEPVAVSAGGVAASPIFVSGTRIIAITGAALVQNCAIVGGGTGPFSVTNTEDGNSAIGPIATYAKPQVKILSFGPSPVTAGDTVTLEVEGTNGSGRGRVVVGGQTVSVTQTSYTNGVAIFTFVVPSNLQFTREPCPGNVGSFPLPTAFDLEFQDVVTGCKDDTLKKGLTVEPPNTGKLFVSPGALTLTTTVGSAAADSFRIVNIGAGMLSVNSVSGASAPFSVAAPGISQPLQACDSVAVSVSFTPTIAGSFSTNVAVSSNGGNASVTVSGTATAPAAPAP